VITDIKYFNRIKWQYMILDEAQAIKSTSSMRWKTLLGFSCRNRLLLSGTPIQNSMAELWALLHFIMPTLFDSHEEFNEWFSKDIESHAENKTGIDESTSIDFIRIEVHNWSWGFFLIFISTTDPCLQINSELE
jgi:DNA helicase INO80